MALVSQMVFIQAMNWLLILLLAFLHTVDLVLIILDIRLRTTVMVFSIQVALLLEMPTLLQSGLISLFLEAVQLI